MLRRPRPGRSVAGTLLSRAPLPSGGRLVLRALAVVRHVDVRRARIEACRSAASSRHDSSSREQRHASVRSALADRLEEIVEHDDDTLRPERPSPVAGDS
jgi:hypothetical protein